MGGWIKTRIRLQEFMGLVKDQVSLGRALVKEGELSQISLAVLRATSHEEQIAEEGVIKAVLEAGGGSRMRVAHCVCAVMDRLNKTHNWIVALKCLLLIHRCLLEGGFMFQDQLSIHPSNGGRNYLNLSNFKDTSSSFTWAVSAWIRWYARYIEQCIQTSRNVEGFFYVKNKEKSVRPEKLMLLASTQLVKEIMSLDDFLHEASGWQAEEFVMNHFLVKGGLLLVSATAMKAYEELQLRFQEVTERIVTLARSEALELLQVCEQLSRDSMILTYLFKRGEDLQAQHEYVTRGKVVYTDYEMLKLKECLKSASIYNKSTSPGRALVNDCPSKQRWSSMRWDIAGPGISTFKRGGSVSNFNFQESPLKF